MWARSTAWSPTASGSTSAPSAGSIDSGRPTVSRWCDPYVLGERAGTAPHADVVGLLAVGGFTGDAGQAAPAAEDRECGDVSTRAPRRIGVGTRGDDHAAELVPHHETGGHRGAQLEVGAADAAGGDLEHELAGPRRRIGDVGDHELVVVVQHGSTHGRAYGGPETND